MIHPHRGGGAEDYIRDWLRLYIGKKMLKDENVIRVGIDIGGTFTDFVLFDSNRQKLVLHKSLTTPSDPSHGAMLGSKRCWKNQTWITRGNPGGSWDHTGHELNNRAQGR